MAYDAPVLSSLYGCYGGGRVCFVVGVGVRCLAVGFGAFLADISIIDTHIHIYLYIDININIDVM